jgi:O-Methyltransferase involved in polyketide biosynthesis
VHWFDLDLPDTIELRRNFFADTGRRRMVAASALNEDWLPAVGQSQGPYFFVAEGVLVYLPEDQVMAALARIAARFPGALVALDTYPKRTFDQQRKLAARKGMEARWAWACDDPRSLDGSGSRSGSPPRSPGRPGPCAPSCPSATGTSSRWPIRPRQGHEPHLVPSQLPGSGRPRRHDAGGRADLSGAGSG